MDSRFASFLLLSTLAHGALIGWQGSMTSQQPPRIGGQAQALRVAVLPAARSDTQTAQQTPVVPSGPPAPLERTAAAAMQAQPPAATDPARALRQRSPRPVAAATPVSQVRAAHAMHMQRAEQQPAIKPATRDDVQRLGQRISAALQQELAKHFEYPWIARKRGWQGQVTLSLQIRENGDLTDWAVSQTSGHKVLDRSALDCARRIDRLPEATRWLDGRSLQLLIPVQYRLRDS